MAEQLYPCPAGTPRRPVRDWVRDGIARDPVNPCVFAAIYRSLFKVEPPFDARRPSKRSYTAREVALIQGHHAQRGGQSNG